MFSLVDLIKERICHFNSEHDDIENIKNKFSRIRNDYCFSAIKEEISELFYTNCCIAASGQAKSIAPREKILEAIEKHDLATEFYKAISKNCNCEKDYLDFYNYVNSIFENDFGKRAPLYINRFISYFSLTVSHVPFENDFLDVYNYFYEQTESHKIYSRKNSWFAQNVELLNDIDIQLKKELGIDIKLSNNMDDLPEEVYENDFTRLVEKKLSERYGQSVKFDLITRCHVPEFIRNPNV